ncbi:DoxX family protein [Streptomyces sp. NPDC002405]|uniref:DoxX family protein n=1 Tax=Streptomyces sp. NPDC057596 TaxID=3346178 RepID=UPI00367FE825
MSERTAPIAPTTSVPASVAAETPVSGRRAARVTLRAVQVLLGLFFVFASALPKLIAHPTAVETFDEMGWGSAGMYSIGVLELAGGVALLVPVLQSVSAVALSALMVGAFIVQLTAFDGQNAATPIVLIVPLAVIAWARRDHNARLLRLVRRQA